MIKDDDREGEKAWSERLLLVRIAHFIRTITGRVKEAMERWLDRLASLGDNGHMDTKQCGAVFDLIGRVWSDVSAAETKSETVVRGGGT